MDILVVTLMILLFPAFLVSAPVFPIWWIGRWRRLRREGEWTAIRGYDDGWKRFLVKVVGLTYALLLLVLFIGGFWSPLRIRLDDLLLSLFLTGLALLVADLAVLMSFSPDEAVERRRAERKLRAPG